MPLIQTTPQSYQFTLFINDRKGLNLDSLCTNNDRNKPEIQTFIEKLNEEEIKDEKSISFNHVPYFSMIVIDILMEKIEILFETTNNQVKSSIDFEPIIISFEVEEKPETIENWFFYINSTEELEYSKNLLYLYKNYVETFLNDSMYDDTDDKIKMYHRFFYTLSEFPFIYI
jgi:hypothetical protein